MKIVDSSGWIEFATDGPLAKRYESHLRDLSKVMTPSIVVYEVYKKLKRDASEAAADGIAVMMGKTRIVALDDPIALQAAEVSLTLGLAMADAIVYATGQMHHVPIITSDADFKSLPDVVYLKK